MRTIELWAAVNLFVCFGCVWACICRLNAMSVEVPKTVRLQFVCLLVGAFASGLQPLLFQQWPGIGQVMLSGGVLLNLLISMPRWRHGPPDDLVKKEQCHADA